MTNLQQASRQSSAPGTACTGERNSSGAGFSRCPHQAQRLAAERASNDPRRRFCRRP